MEQSEKPLLVLLHAFGSSRHAWDDIIPQVSGDVRIYAPDLPGFGDAAPRGAQGVAETAEWLIREIAQRLGPGGWLVAGHSMGGKFATILASGAVGEIAPARGVLLLAGSPPSPEPMGEERRAEMIGWAQDGRIDAREARTFLEANVGEPLAAEAEGRALADIMASAPEAWAAWLETGSREDWSVRVGKPDMPCIILVGSRDGDLGEAGQRATNMTVYRKAELRVEDGCGHLLPLERPAAVVSALRALQRLAADTPSRAAPPAAPRSA